MATSDQEQQATLWRAPRGRTKMKFYDMEKEKNQRKTSRMKHLLTLSTLIVIMLAPCRPAAGHSEPGGQISGLTTNQQAPNQTAPLALAHYSLVEEQLAESGAGHVEHPEEEAQQPDFRLMNAAQDKLTVVRTLLETRQQFPADGQEHAVPSGNNLVCTHKGRQYQNGQQVFIEEQPCLNCTCSMAILQCYLRVCPPVVSLEAHKRKLLAAAGFAAPTSEAHHECRMVKDPHQCCPVMRCDDELGTTRQQQGGSNNKGGSVSNSSSLAIPESRHDDTPAAAPLMNRSAEVKLTTGMADQLAASSQQVVTTSLPPAASVHFDHLPKLTVINGPAGQRESILLITSNPSPQALAQATVVPFTRRQLVGNSSSALDTHPNVVSSAPIIEALLETIYSSAASQLQGLNLQGSCMINGSLYFEGSAVLPAVESAAQQCQYCYCIRQKVMCVRPRCHLLISGCTAKYSNEFACCPTSYACETPAISATPSSSSSSLARLTSANHGYLLPMSMTSAFEEALTKTAAARQTAPVDDPELTPRQIDGGGSSSSSSTTSAGTTTTSTTTPATQAQRITPEQSGLQADERRLLSLLSSLLSSDQKETPALNATITSTTTTTTSTSTTSTSTTPAPPARTDNEEEREDDTEDKELDELSPTSEVKPTKRPPRKSVSSTTSTTNSPMRTTTEQSRSSVANFLEPMNKLGPHMNTPSSPAGCSENNRNYSIGEQIPTLESCKHCYCGPEGFKECKMVECDLRGDHNCRPITPEGHCCPIRFECDAERPSDGMPLTSTTVDPKSDSSSSISKPTLPFRGTEQCNTSISLDGQDHDDCQHSNEPVPLLKSTRFISEPANLSLSEELDRFIMRIRPNGTAAMPTNEGQTDYSLLASNDTGRHKHVDYDAVRYAEPGASRSPIPPGMVGIPSIEPEVIGNLAAKFPGEARPPSTNTGVSSMVEYADVAAAAGPGSQRDMRSTNAHMLNMGADDRFKQLNELLASRQQAEPAATNGTNAVPSPAPFSVSSDDYADLSDGAESPGSEPPLTVNNQHEDSAELAHLRRSLRDERARNNSGQLSPIYFDDNNTTNAFVYPVESGASTEGANNDDELGTTATPSPPQPTTGTPIGLDAERAVSPDTTSWLRLLPSWTRTFGQRLSGHDAFQGAASGSEEVPSGRIATNATLGSLTLVAENSVRSAVPPPTGRSAHQNPIISMIKSIIATAAGQEQQQQQQQQQSSLRSEPRAANLVMRPLENVMAPAGVNWQESDEVSARPRTSTSPPYEPASSSSDLEIITAPAPLEPEMFGQTRAPSRSVNGNQELVVRASSSFARRSDVDTEEPEMAADVPRIIAGRRLSNDSRSDESSVRYFASTSQAQSSQVSTSKPNQQSQQRGNPTSALACFDAATNTTYQLNERIPKPGEPCRACTCLLGREICQPLVCPERPAENCHEERRPGECCANYLCGGAHNSSPMLDASATQRSIMGAQGGVQNGAVTDQSARMPGLMQQQARALQQPTANQLAQGYQIRTGDLASILPPHLRFRSNLAKNEQQPRQMAMPPMNHHRHQQQQLFNYDTNRMHFPTQQQRQNPALLTDSNVQSTSRRNSFISSDNSLFQPPVLMHPQRLMPPQAPMRRHDLDQAQQLSAFPNNQLAQSANSRLQPTLVPTISHFPVPPSESQSQSEAQPTANRISSLRFPVPTGESWRQQQQVAVAGQPAISMQLPPQVTAAVSSPLHRTEAASSGSADKILFRTQASDQLPFRPLASGNSMVGLKPLAAPQQPAITSSNIPREISSEPSVSLPSTPSVTASVTPRRFSQPELPPIVVSELSLVSGSSGSPFDLAPTSPVATSSSTTLLTDINSATDTRESTPSKDTLTSTASASTHHQLAAEITTTESSTPISSSTITDAITITTTTAAPTTATSTSTTTTIEGSSSTASSLDLSDLLAFRVSECDIYGRVYRVGQPIGELSDSCKKCTCTSAGVECRHVC